MKYEIILTSSFKKELKIAIKRNKDIKKLKEVVDTLASGQKLDKKYKDHQLVNTTRFKNCRECHIEPNWLLVYRINDNELILMLVELGSHSDLF